MKIICDEKICVRCLACVSESEFGGGRFKSDGTVGAEFCVAKVLRVKL